MEIEQVLLDLTREQAATQQSVIDLGNRLLGANGQPGALTILSQDHKELEDRVKSVEKKVWYFSGAGTVLGTALSYLGYHIKH